MTTKKVAVIYKKSVFELYSTSPNEHVRAYVNAKTAEAERMRKSHDYQQKTLEQVVKTLDLLGFNHQEIYRAHLADAKDLERNHLAIAVGGDGTFLEVSHYVKKAPLLLGVNSDPKASRGFYCTATAETFEQLMRSIDRSERTTVSRMEITLDGKVLPELALNDVLVAHSNPAAMTRYQLIADSKKREVRSSGLLACTAAGSTGWMYNEGGNVMPIHSTMIQYLNRGLRGEKPQQASELAIVCATREGKLYVDGQHLTYDLTLGSRLEIRKGLPLTIIGNLEEKRALHYRPSLPCMQGPER